MRRILGGLAIAAAVVAGPAAAQTVGYNWTGYYAGVHLGYGWSDNTANFDYAPAGVCDPAPGDCPDGVSFSGDGVIGGAHIGANWHQNFWLFGLEGDIDGTGISGDGSATSGLTTINASTELDWLATIRGRAGVVADRAMVYLTGGLALGDVNNSASLESTSTAVPGLGGSWSGSGSSVQAGWTIGGGVEFAPTNKIIIGFEALYVDLGSTSVDLEQSPEVSPPDISASFDNEFVIARARVSYKW